MTSLSSTYPIMQPDYTLFHFGLLGIGVLVVLVVIALIAS